jgi:predicted transcriptional regulator
MNRRQLKQQRRDKVKKAKHCKSDIKVFLENNPNIWYSYYDIALSVKCNKIVVQRHCNKLFKAGLTDKKWCYMPRQGNVDNYTYLKVKWKVKVNE